MHTLKDLLENQLKMLYDTEEQLIDSFQGIIDKTTDEQLHDAFIEQLNETKLQKSRLSEIGEELKMDLSSYTCKTAKGLIKETEEFLTQDLTDSVKDAGLIMHSQQAGHHKIAGYGSACAFAEELGYEGVKKKLQKNLDAEKTTDEELSDLAVRLNSIAQEEISRIDL